MMLLNWAHLKKSKLIKINYTIFYELSSSFTQLKLDPLKFLKYSNNVWQIQYTPQWGLLMKDSNRSKLMVPSFMVQSLKRLDYMVEIWGYNFFILTNHEIVASQHMLCNLCCMDSSKLATYSCQTHLMSRILTSSNIVL